MRRVLRWLWRQCRQIVLIGLLLIGGAMLVPALPAHAFAERPTQISQAGTTTASPDELTPRDRERARERARRDRLLYAGALAYEAALLLGFLVLGGTRWLAKLTARFGKRWVPALVIVLAIVSVGGAVLTLPLDYYTGFIFQHQYGLSNQTSGQWFRDYLVGEGLGMVIGLPLLLLAYALLRAWPRSWWLWLTAASAPISIVLMLIAPVFISPLFNTFTPVKDATLRQEILDLAHAQGIPARDVYQVDASRQSRMANAYVIGFGPTLRIVLYDTLLEEFTREEILYILAHEMGHYKLGHIYQGIGMSILGTLIGSFLYFLMANRTLRRFGERLGIHEVGHPAGFPLLLAIGMLISLLALPVGNAFSRYLEWQADRYAAKTYPHWDAGISTFRKFARINVAEEDPPNWVVTLLYTHPSLEQRIRALQALKAGNPHPWPLPGQQ